MSPRLILLLVAATVIVREGVAAGAEGQMKLRLSWGHQSPADTPFYVRLLASGAELSHAAGFGMEEHDGLRDGAWQTRAGGGDVDGVEVVLCYPPEQPKGIANLNSIWAALIAQSDADTARRLRGDPALRRDTRKLTVQMDRDGSKGFSVAVGQLLEHRALWAPSLDAYITAGDPPVTFADHQQELRQWQGKRILDQVHREPEATYQQYAARWEDMGSPRYVHPSQPAPGHIVCLSWESALNKFGVDRGGGVWNDLGNPDRFRFWFDFGVLSKESAVSWKGQKLADGLPIITTAIEREALRYEVEQFAYPLHGPPQQRRGDLPMLLLQRVRITNLANKPRTVAVTLHHGRDLLADAEPALVRRADGSGFAVEETAARRVLLGVQGEKLDIQLQRASGDGPAKKPPLRACSLAVSFDLPAGGSRQFVVKLASPPIARDDVETLFRLDYAAARDTTVKFWSDCLARGAQFRVPEKAVNDLFRASLWHALRLPRRHGGPQPDVKIDLPYSNFAYEQRGTPWPVNQAVYVDYMLYDLRGV